MIIVKPLGGSGEDSRNCFLVCSEQGNILLDCGVRREIANLERVYPLLTQEIVDGLDAVYLSHAHEDHTAALPYLHNLGYRGPIYASKETIELTPSYLRKWRDYVKEHDGTLPFDDNDITDLDFKTIDERTPLLIQTGRSGHIIGGLWMLFEIENKRILYTGDITYESLLLKTDPLPKADVLIIDSAYAGRHLNQNDQYQHIYEIATKTISNNGSVLLPVPANGRGIDIYQYLKQFDLPIVVEDSILKNSEVLKQHSSWIIDSELLNTTSDNVFVANDGNRNQALQKPSVIIAPDGMLTNYKALYYFDQLKADSNSCVVISGHSAIGTLGNSIQKEQYRIDNSIKLKVELCTIKVHLDDDNVIEQVKNVEPTHVLLFHSAAENCLELKNNLTNVGFNVVADLNHQLEI